jgi:hypothetical protein
MCKRLGGPQENLAPTMIWSPGRSAYSKSLYRLSYPGPQATCGHINLLIWIPICFSVSLAGEGQVSSWLFHGCFGLFIQVCIRWPVCDVFYCLQNASLFICNAYCTCCYGRHMEQLSATTATTYLCYEDQYLTWLLQTFVPPIGIEERSPVWQ